MVTYPLFEDERLRLSGIMPHLQEAYERARHKTRDFFQQEGNPHNPWVFSTLIRYHVVNQLKAKCEILPGLNLRELNNNGMQFKWNHRNYRVWKADAGAIPPPGPSHTKADYLVRNPTLFDFGDLVEWNLVLLWDFDTWGQPIFRLAFPEELNGQWGNPSTVWNDQLPFDLEEMLAGEVDLSPGPSDGELDLEPNRDTDRAEGE